MYTLKKKIESISEYSHEVSAFLLEYFYYEVHTLFKNISKYIVSI